MKKTFYPNSKSKNQFDSNVISDLLRQKFIFLKSLFTLLFLLLFLLQPLFAIDIKGYIDKDSVISLSNSPCNITGDLYVRNGAKLTIEDGVEVNFMNAGYDLFVGYSASSLGTLNAKNVTFNGYGPLTVDEKIQFRYNSTGSLENCTFNNVSVLFNESSASVLNSTFSNTVNPFEFVNECSPTLSNISFSNVTYPGIKMTGTVNTDWTMMNYGFPYFIAGTITVNGGATLTIAVNDSVKFVGGYPINIGSSTSSLGNVVINGVHFEGVTNNTNDLLSFRYGSTGTVTNSLFTDVIISCAESAPTITGCKFDNANIILTEASPVIQNNSFANVAYPIEFINECSPTLGALTLTNVTNEGVKLTGTVNSDWTLLKYNLPYYLGGTFTVNSGATLTMVPNDTIRFAGNYSILIGSSTSSMGKIIANGVHFEGITTGTSDLLSFRYGSTGTVTNSTFTASNISCSESAPTISGCTFDNANIILTESSPVIQNNTFSNVTYPIEFVNECSPTIGSLSMNNVTNEGIKFTGTVNSDWTMNNYGYPYYLAGSITVNAGATLTMLPNDTIIYTGNYTINIGSSTSSLGSVIANGVHFEGITSGTSDQLAFKYGSTGTLTNCSFTAANVTCSESAPEVTGCRFDNAGIILTESSPILQNNTFANVTYPIEFVNECSPTIGTLTMNNVTNEGIKLSGTVNSDWTLLKYNVPYYLASSLTINNGATFTMVPNDTIRFAGSYSILVGSSASSLGIVMANGVHFEGSTSTTSDQLTFRYGSGGTVSNCSFTSANITCSESSPTITGCKFDNANIILTESSPVIQNVNFHNITYPLEFVNECSPTIGTLILNNVTNEGIKLTGTVNSDWTMNNYGYPYYLAGTFLVNSGATLTMVPNDTIRFVGGYSITVGSSTSSLGKVVANGVHFDGVTNSTGDQLYFRYGSTGTVTNCSFKTSSLVCSESNPEITGCSFDEANIILTESSPDIQNNTFANIAYPIEFVNECTPAIGKVTMNNVTYEGIKLSGTVNTDWTLVKYNIPYYMGSSLTVNSGATLTILPTDTIRFAGGYALTIGSSTSSLGNIIANGAYFDGLSNSTGDQLAFKYGSTGTVTNCTFFWVNLTSSASNPEITNNTFDNANIILTESSAVINNNTISNVAYPIEFFNECSPTIGALTLNNVTYEGIKFSGTVNTDWTLMKYDLPYYLTASLTVNAGATMTSAPYNIIYFNGYNISVGSSTSSTGVFNAKANQFKNLRTSDAYLYIRYGSTGKIDSCDISGIRLYIDASNPQIINSKIHKSQNAIYLTNNASPEITSNIFYNNTIALKNIGTVAVSALNNFWGHYSGPMHADNPNGVGETIDGPAGFIPFADEPKYGEIISQLSVDKLQFESIAVGNYQDTTLTVKSLGDVDLLIPDITTDNPSFKVILPSTGRAWVSSEDSLLVKLRFQPQAPVSYNSKAFIHSNDKNNSEYIVNLTGNGLPVLSFSNDTVSFDSVPIKGSQARIMSITNLTTNSIVIDSLVNYNPNFFLKKTTQPTPVLVKAITEKDENVEDTESGIVSTGFTINANETAFVEIEYWPYKSPNDTDSIKIYYNKGAVHKIHVKAKCLAAELGTQVVSLDYRQFPSIYLNAEIDTFAVTIKTLTNKEIQIFENGILQTEGIKITPPGEGNNTRLTDIVFIMDNSGSLGGEQAKVKSNVYKFLTKLNNSGIDYALGLCRYGASENSGKPIIEDNGVLTKDSTYFKNDLWNRNNTSGSSEPGYYAIMESAAKFKFRPGAQKIFIIITDETPKQGSIGTQQGAIDACQNQKISLFALTVQELYSEFRAVTQVTNGRTFNILSEFDIILNMISEMVSDNYVIRYKALDTNLDGIKRIVELRVNYKTAVASDTTSYVPGAIPTINRTSATLSLHTQSWNPGTPLTIEVEVKDAIPPYVNDVTLSCRISQTSVYTTIPMNSTDGIIYSAIIPDSLVQAPGVDYFITATDGMVTSDDPAIDAINSPYQIAVIPNFAPVIVHTPVAEAILGENIVISAIVTDNTNVLNSVDLYYRKAGQLVFTKLAMTAMENNKYEAIISGAFSTSENIEYYIKATDDYNVSSYATWPNNPYIIKLKSEVGLQTIYGITLAEIYPNPIKNKNFVIKFNAIENIEKMTVNIYSATGVKLYELYNGNLLTGENVIPVNLNEISSGIYLIEFNNGHDVRFVRIIVE